MLPCPTVRRLLIRGGLTSPRQRRPPRHRCRRQRMPQEGMLLQLDGSHHLWLEDRWPWLTLLLAVDDATGKAPHALFQEQEDTRGYLSLLQGIIERLGVPMAVYTDRLPSFSPGVVHRTDPQFARKGLQPNGAGIWESWGSPRYWPTAPRPKGGWRGPMELSKTGWWRNCGWLMPAH